MVVEAVADLRHGADGRDASARHDGDVIGQLLQFVQFMAGNQQTFALFGQLAEQRDKLRSPHGINAAERFVKDQQLWIGESALEPT